MWQQKSADRTEIPDERKKKFENLEFPSKNLFLQLQFSQLYQVSQKRFMEAGVHVGVERHLLHWQLLSLCQGGYKCVFKVKENFLQYPAAMIHWCTPALKPIDSVQFLIGVRLASDSKSFSYIYNLGLFSLSVNHKYKTVLIVGGL